MDGISYSYSIPVVLYIVFRDCVPGSMVLLTRSARESFVPIHTPRYFIVLLGIIGTSCRIKDIGFTFRLLVSKEFASFAVLIS